MTVSPAIISWKLCFLVASSLSAVDCNSETPLGQNLEDARTMRQVPQLLQVLPDFFLAQVEMWNLIS